MSRSWWQRLTDPTKPRPPAAAESPVVGVEVRRIARRGGSAICAWLVAESRRGYSLDQTVRHWWNGTRNQRRLIRAAYRDGLLDGWIRSGRIGDPATYEEAPR